MSGMWSVGKAFQDTIDLSALQTNPTHNKIIFNYGNIISLTYLSTFFTLWIIQVIFKWLGKLFKKSFPAQLTQCIAALTLYRWHSACLRRSRPGGLPVLSPGFSYMTLLYWLNHLHALDAFPLYGPHPFSTYMSWNPSWNLLHHKTETGCTPHHSLVFSPSKRWARTGR